MKTYPQRRRQKGFSIIEALIASVVVAVGLLGAAKFQTELLRQSTSVKDRSMALSAANELIESVRANNIPMVYNALFDGSDVSNAYATASSGAMTRDWYVTDFGAQNYKGVKVDVNWTDSSSNNTASLATYISRNDPLSSGSSIIFAGSSNNTSSTTFSGIVSGTITQKSGHADWQISISQGKCISTANIYTCGVSAIPNTTTQVVTVTFTPDDHPCGSAQAVVSLSAANPSQMADFAHALDAAGCV